jgi:hypothetical protein
VFIVSPIWLCPRVFITVRGDAPAAHLQERCARMAKIMRAPRGAGIRVEVRDLRRRFLRSGTVELREA